MIILIRIVAGLLLAAHGLVHLLYFVANPEDPRWPFTLQKSWILPEALRRPAGIALIGLTVMLFLLLGLAVAGVPGLSSIWPLLAVAGSAVSLLTLAAFWNTQLLFGVAIDVALIAVALIRPDWTESLG